MRALGPGSAFRESWRLFTQRPFATLALGLALLTSLIAVCCGLGVIAAPWFLCELFALQIALGSGTRPPRTRAWLWAGFVQMLAVLLLCAVVAITLLSIGPDVMIGGGASGPRLAESAVRSLVVWLVAGGLTLALTVYFEHAPSLLLERGGGLTAALLESARLVADTGPLRTWFTSGVAHGLQLAPIVLGVTAGAAFGTLSSTLLWGLALLPVAALCLALGQGMVVASYLSLRDLALEPARAPVRGALSTSRALLWSVLLVGVVSGPVAVSAALVRPALPYPGPVESAPEPLLVFELAEEPVVRFIPDTAVRVRASRRRVHVEASDGGGAGSLPLPSQELARLSVLRVATSAVPGAADEARRFGSVYALEVRTQDGRAFTTWIDDAGVRLDDSLARRLASLLPSWALFALAGCLVWSALWIALALPPQGRVRRELSERLSSPDIRHTADDLDQKLRGQTLRAALWLCPAAFSSLAIGLWALLGEGNLQP